MEEVRRASSPRKHQKTTLAKMPVQTHYPNIAKWARKIGNLLDQHHITSWDNKRHFIVALKVLDLGGRAQVALAESPS